MNKIFLHLSIGIIFSLSFNLNAADSENKDENKEAEQTVSQEGTKVDANSKIQLHKLIAPENSPEKTPSTKVVKSLEQNNFVPPAEGENNIFLQQAQIYNLMPQPDEAECQRFQYREEHIQEILRSRSYAPLSQRDQDRAEWCRIEARNQAVQARQEREEAQAQVQAQRDSCRNLGSEIQTEVNNRNNAARECSQGRQVCLQADQTYQNCTHNRGVGGFFRSLAFNLIGDCDDEHEAKQNACDYFFNPQNATGIHSISDLQALHCEAFYNQTTNDSICGSRHHYIEGNCPVIVAPLEFEERLAWYCTPYDSLPPPEY